VLTQFTSVGKARIAELDPAARDLEAVQIDLMQARHRLAVRAPARAAHATPPHMPMERSAAQRSAPLVMPPSAVSMLSGRGCAVQLLKYHYNGISNVYLRCARRRPPFRR
jgi:hypothetical protein